MSPETWWCRCTALSDATSRIRKFCEFCVHVKLAEVDQSFTAKDLGRGVIDTCSTGSISGTGTGTNTGIYIDLYRIPVLYRYNTCRNSENAFRIPTLIQRKSDSDNKRRILYRIMISDLRFSLGRRVRLISFLRHIGEGIEPPPSLRGVGA